MEKKLLDFIALYWGGGLVGTNPANTGQCVGLVELWFGVLGTPPVWGNAKDLLANADPKSYVVTNNGPTNAPPPGAVVCWDGTWGGGFGHTAVVVLASAMRLLVFEQNNPDGSPPILGLHGYSGVQGWLTPVKAPA